MSTKTDVTSSLHNRISRWLTGPVGTTILTVREITVLCHFHKNDLMPVIICKNNKHIVILYKVLFSDMTGILSHLSYIFY